MLRNRLSAADLTQVGGTSRRYRNLVDEWAVYDNSGETPILLEEGSRS